MKVIPDSIGDLNNHIPPQKPVAVVKKLADDVLIAENTFVNTLTSPFQFTEAVISICPEIPEIKEDSPYLHRNITIKDNVFAAFDKPLVFAKSVDGLVIKDNAFVKTDTYAPYHWHQQWLTLRHCKNVDAEAPRGWKE